jgi:hypothetical protein
MKIDAKNETTDTAPFNPVTWSITKCAHGTPAIDEPVRRKREIQPPRKNKSVEICHSARKM